MSVKQALLALLEQGPMYGYQLRAEFEQRTGSTWPLNVGQVYTTLTRLERDGLVESSEEDEASTAHGAIYRVTTEGRDEVAAWFTTPVARTQPPRDELAIKLAIAVTVPGVDVGTIIQRQRSATMSALQDYARLKRQGRGGGPGDRDDRDDRDDMAWSLVLDSLVFAAEAEIRWLDHCESRLRRAAARHPRRARSGARRQPVDCGARGSPVSAGLHWTRRSGCTARKDAGSPSARCGCAAGERTSAACSRPPRQGGIR